MKRKLQRALNKVKALTAVAGAAAIVGATNANAALDLTTLTLNTADVETIMGYVVTALAALWGFRKVVKTMNRS